MDAIQQVSTSVLHKISVDLRQKETHALRYFPIQKKHGSLTGSTSCHVASISRFCFNEDAIHLKLHVLLCICLINILITYLH
jgi:hypothetical protein